MFLDNYKIEFECPSCGFFNYFLFKQARFRDVIICRGCKANIHLDDNMNECRIATKAINQARAELENSIKNINLNFRL